MQYQITSDGHPQNNQSYEQYYFILLTILCHAESYVNSAYGSSWQRVKELREDFCCCETKIYSVYLLMNMLSLHCRVCSELRRLAWI